MINTTFENKYGFTAEELKFLNIRLKTPGKMFKQCNSDLLSISTAMTTPNTPDKSMIAKEISMSNQQIQTDLNTSQDQTTPHKSVTTQSIQTDINIPQDYTEKYQKQVLDAHNEKDQHFKCDRLLEQRIIQMESDILKEQLGYREALNKIKKKDQQLSELNESLKVSRLFTKQLETRIPDLEQTIENQENEIQALKIKLHSLEVKKDIEIQRLNQQIENKNERIDQKFLKEAKQCQRIIKLETDINEFTSAQLNMTKQFQNDKEKCRLESEFKINKLQTKLSLLNVEVESLHLENSNFITEIQKFQVIIDQNNAVVISDLDFLHCIYQAVIIKESLEEEQNIRLNQLILKLLSFAQIDKSYQKQGPAAQTNKRLHNLHTKIMYLKTKELNQITNTSNVFKCDAILSQIDQNIMWPIKTLIEENVIKTKVSRPKTKNTARRGGIMLTDIPENNNEIE